MNWLILLLSFTALAFAFISTSVGLLTVCLIAAGALFLLWIYVTYRMNFADSGRDITTAIDLDELRRLREKAQANQQSSSQDSSSHDHLT